MHNPPRQFAFKALQRIQRGAFADIALDQVLKKSNLDQRDRRFVTELVYGTIRQQRTLDALIEQFAQKPAHQHPANLQLILRLGFYQLRYLEHVPPSAAVNTTVDLAKTNGFKGLKGFVNAILRQYLRARTNNDALTPDQHSDQQHHEPSRSTQAVTQRPGSTALKTRPVFHDPLHLPDHEVERLGVLYSYPDWIIATWLDALEVDETVQLCQWFNQAPAIDLRVNPLRSSIDRVEDALQTVNLACSRVHHLPHTLRLVNRPGLIQALPGFQEGWWTVQDASAQLVGYLLNPQPGEIIIDACAAPGGKTTHIAELMEDTGEIWACDRHASRLRKVTENSQRLHLHSIQTQARDCTLTTIHPTSDHAESSHSPNTGDNFAGIADRVLVDAPCSGLGTLHRHADARWRHTPKDVADLTQIQTKLLAQTSRWVKPGGVLVYSTCTLHPSENERMIAQFLDQYPEWCIDLPTENTLLTPFLQPEGWLKVWPHHQDMDGFFMARLKRR